MPTPKVNFKWYHINHEGQLDDPVTEKRTYCGVEILRNDRGFDTEIEAVNALVEYVGGEDYEALEYVLIKSYHVCNRY